MCYYGSNGIALRRIQEQSQKLCRKMLTSLDTIRLVFSNSATMLRLTCLVGCCVVGWTPLFWSHKEVCVFPEDTLHCQVMGAQQEWKVRGNKYIEFLDFYIFVWFFFLPLVLSVFLLTLWIHQFLYFLYVVFFWEKVNFLYAVWECVLNLCWKQSW